MGHNEVLKAKYPHKVRENSNNIMMYFKDLEKQKQPGGGSTHL